MDVNHSEAALLCPLDRGEAEGPMSTERLDPDPVLALAEADIHLALALPDLVRLATATLKAELQGFAGRPSSQQVAAALAVLALAEKRLKHHRRLHSPLPKKPPTPDERRAARQRRLFSIK